jgi:uncharacterized membrane protein YsdA (DUF1294 family)/cold shock CspA family protein
MRQEGRLTHWKDDQGYGFITPKGGGPAVFANIKSFSNRQKRPRLNDLVEFTLVCDAKDRARAEDVSFVVDPVPLKSYGWGDVALTLAVFFVLFVAKSVFDGVLPLPVLPIYLIASTITFFTYWYDKAQARKHQWRTSEGTLHFWSLVGGWPGAALAQKVVHHKSRKRSFQTIYWITITLNVLGLVWLLSSPGAAQARTFLDELTRR